MPIINRASLYNQIDIISEIATNSFEITDSTLLRIQVMSLTEQSNMILLSRILKDNADLHDIIMSSLDYTNRKFPLDEGIYERSMRPNNTLVYSLSEYIFERSVNNNSFLNDYKKLNENLIKEAIHSSYTRLGSSSIRDNFISSNMMIPNATIKLSSSIFAASEFLKESLSSSLNFFFQCTNSRVQSLTPHMIMDIPLIDIFDIAKYRGLINKTHYNFKQMGLNMFIYPFGNFYVLIIDHDSFLLTYEITRRASELLEEFAKLSLLSQVMDLSETDIKYFLKKMFREILSISRWDPEMVGEIIKAARNLYLAKQETTNILGTSMYDLLCLEYTEEKLKYAKKFLSFIESSFTSIRYSVMFSHIYKVSAHPDVDISSAFKKLEGLYEPNKVDSNIFTYYRGVLRRSIFESLAKSRKNPRLSEGPLVEKSLTSQYNYKLLINASAMSWADCKFEINSQLPRFDDMVVKVSNKSSAPSTSIRYRDFEKMKSFYNKDISKRSILNLNLVRKFLSKNDSETTLLGESMLSAHCARDKIEKLVSAYQNIQDRNPGIDFDEIPISEFIQEFKASRDNFHIVGTEPKLGEKHKKETRMFYMAEQPIKAYTQRCERLARQISRHQRGVSITKSSAGRDRDLNSFISSMRYVNTDEDYCFFISFDMSSFSMKFPHVLLDDYGEILYELTGDAIYKHLSIVFKMAVVYNNTRESFEYIPAPKGGFEGFFNFIWTSIHAAILETSLMKTGLAGEVLTYSDDGILKIYFKDITGRSPLEIVETIKRTYSSLGLEFNLGKTLVSPIIWEYLGKVCYKGSIISSYSKELSTLGVEETTRSFNPVSLRLNSLIGQMRATVAAGMPVFCVSVIGTFYTFKMIVKLNRLTPLKILRYLVIIPESCGGLRIPSSIELSVSGGTNGLIEFMADLAIYSEYNNKVTSAIISHIYNNMKDADVVTLALRKCYVGVQGMDNSGRSVMLAIIDEARKKSKIDIPDDPLNDNIRLKLSEIMLQVDNIDLEIFGNIIRSVPSVVAYEDIIALTKTQAIFRLISKRKIQSYQSKDTVKVRKNINHWSDILTGNLANQQPLSPVLLYEKVDHMCFDKLCIFRPSIRIMYTSENSVFYTVVKTEYPRISMNDVNNSPFDFDYTEVMKFTKQRDVDLVWDAESFGYSEEFYVRQFAYKLINLITSNINMWGPAKDIVSLFSVDIVLTYCMNKVNKSIYRKRVNKGKNLDITIKSPQGLEGITYIFNSPEVYYDIEKYPNSDLSTYPGLAKALFLSFISYVKPELGKISSLKFNFNSKWAHYLIHPDRMDVSDYKRVFTDITKPLVNRIMSIEVAISEAIDDIIIEDDLADKLQDIPGFDESSTDIYNSFVQEFHIHLLKDYILHSINDRSMRNIVEPPKIPININIRIKFISTAIVEAVYETYSSSQLAIIYKELKTMEYGIITDSKFIMEFGLNKFIDMAYEIISSVYVSVLPSDVKREIYDIEFHIEKIHTYIYKRDIFKQDDQILLMISDNPSSNYSKQNLHGIISKLYKNQLVILNNGLRNSNWSVESIDPELRNIFQDDIDIAYDVFSITSSIMRYSTHRESIMFPFNIRMATVMLIQCWAINYHVMSFPDHYIESAGGVSYLNKLIPSLLGKTDERFTYMLDYAYNMYHENLYGVIQEMSGPDHWYRASDTIYPVIIKRCIDRYKLGKKSPKMPTAKALWYHAHGMITRFNIVMGRAISAKISINYVPRNVREKLIEKGLKLDVTDIIIDNKFCVRPKKILLKNIYEDKDMKFEILYSIKLTVSEACKKNIMPQVKTKYLDENLMKIFRKHSGPVDTHFNNLTPNLANIIIFEVDNFSESLYLYKLLCKTNKGLSKIFVGTNRKYRVISYGFLSPNLIDIINNYEKETDSSFNDTKDDDYDPVKGAESNASNISFNDITNINDDVKEIEYIESCLVTNTIDFDEIAIEEYYEELKLDDIRNNEDITERLTRDKVSISKDKRNNPPRIMDDEPLLALATCILRGDFIKGQMSKVFSYIILMIDYKLRVPGITCSYRQREVNMEFDELYSSILTELMKPPSDSHRLREDIAYVTSWLYKNPIESNNPIYKATRNRLMRMDIPNLQNTIPMIEIYGKTITIDEYIKTKKANESMKVGDIYKELIVTTDIDKDRHLIKKFLNDKITSSVYYNALALSGHSKLTDDDAKIDEINPDINVIEDKVYTIDMLQEIEAKEVAKLIIDGKVDPAILGDFFFNDVEAAAYDSEYADEWDKIAMSFNLPWF